MKKKLWPGWWTASDRIPQESGRGLARSRWRCCRGPSGSRCCSWRGRPAGRTGGRPPGHQVGDGGNYYGTHCLVIEEVEMNAAIYRHGSLHKPNKCQMISKILRGGNCLEKVNKSIRSGGWSFWQTWYLIIIATVFFGKLQASTSSFIARTNPSLKRSQPAINWCKIPFFKIFFFSVWLHAFLVIFSLKHRGQWPCSILSLILLTPVAGWVPEYYQDHSSWFLSNQDSTHIRTTAL